MTTSITKLNPVLSLRFNFVADCLLLLLASFYACSQQLWPVSHVSNDALLVPMAALVVWIMGARVLRHYDAAKPQLLGGDLVLTGVLLISVTLFLQLAHIIFRVPLDLTRFLLAYWPLTLLLRVVSIGPRLLQNARVYDVLIVGTGPLGRATGEDLRDTSPNVRVLGYLSFPNEPDTSKLPFGCMGTLEALEAYLKQHAISEVYVAGNFLRQGMAMQAAIQVCEKFGVPFALPAGGFRFDRAKPAFPKRLPDGYVHYLTFEHKPAQWALKRLTDVLFSALALAALSPLLLVVSLVIKLTSPGPVLFKQLRVGLHGRQFYMLKFRSMVVNAEELKKKLMEKNEQTGPVFKMLRDPRVTAIGRFIRKYSIDELPQLVNVLRGEMSLVGPRPPIPSEVAQYEGWQRRRLSVRPGLTCVWQVSGRNQISFEEWMYLDMRYIDHWSLGQDFNLILKTVGVVISGRGAS